MPRIIETRFVSNDKIQIKIEMGYMEFQSLKGCMENIYVFSEDNLDYNSRLVQRGKRESTKYFLLPKEKRKEAIPNPNVRATVLENNSELIYIFKITKY